MKAIDNFFAYLKSRNGYLCREGDRKLVFKSRKDSNCRVRIVSYYALYGHNNRNYCVTFNSGNGDQLLDSRLETTNVYDKKRYDPLAVNSSEERWHEFSLYLTDRHVKDIT